MRKSRREMPSLIPPSSQNLFGNIPCNQSPAAPEPSGRRHVRTDHDRGHAGSVAAHGEQARAGPAAGADIGHLDASRLRRGRARGRCPAPATTAPRVCRASSLTPALRSCADFDDEIAATEEQQARAPGRLAAIEPQAETPAGPHRGRRRARDWACGSRRGRGRKHGRIGSVGEPGQPAAACGWRSTSDTGTPCVESVARCRRPASFAPSARCTRMARRSSRCWALPRSATAKVMPARPLLSRGWLGCELDPHVGQAA